MIHSIQIDPDEDDEDCDCQCFRSYAPSSIGSPPPKCLTLDDDDVNLEVSAAFDGDAPTCVYDPKWFGLPPNACPRILVSFALPVPQAIGWSHVSSSALAPNSSGMASYYPDAGLLA
jgi:hypothetical protein